MFGKIHMEPNMSNVPLDTPPNMVPRDVQQPEMHFNPLDVSSITLVKSLDDFNQVASNGQF
jgi:hypothetical protein